MKLKSTTLALVISFFTQLSIAAVPAAYDSGWISSGAVATAEIYPAHQYARTSLKDEKITCAKKAKDQFGDRVLAIRLTSNNCEELAFLGVVCGFNCQASIK